MKRRRVLIELMPARIDVVLCNGTTPIACRRLDVKLESDPADWVRSVRKASARLKVAVAELSAENLSATVLYRSPTQSVDLVSLPVRSHHEATSAATLSCLDSLTYSAMAAICETYIIGRDAAGEERRTHTVVAADREDISAAILALVEDSGLVFDSATPLDGAILAMLARESLENSGDRKALLYTGEHRSFFMISERGSLLFGRAIGIGYDALVGGLTRLFEDETDDDDHEHEVGRALLARRVLFDHGFPDREAMIDEQRGLRGYDIVPLMQPVLQRFVVELRQSLRFGLHDEQRSDFPIEMRGPGRYIPHLAEVIGKELGHHMTTASGSFDFEEPAAAGSVVYDAIRQPFIDRELNLQPEARAVQRRTRRLRTLLWTGAGVAMLMIGMDVVHFHLKLDDARGEVKSLSSKLETYESLRQTNDQLLTAVNAMRDLDDRIAASLGARPDHAALLREFGRLAPAPIRLSAISTRASDKGVAGNLSGYVFGSDGPPDETELERFITTLRGSPLFSSVSLDNVQIGAVGEQAGQRFEVKFDVIPTPREQVVAAVPPDSAGEGP